MGIGMSSSDIVIVDSKATTINQLELYPCTSNDCRQAFQQEHDLPSPQIQKSICHQQA